MMNVNIKYKYKGNLPAESAESVSNVKVTMPKNKFFISMSNKFSKRKNRNTKVQIQIQYFCQRQDVTVVICTEL